MITKYSQLVEKAALTRSDNLEKALQDLTIHHMLKECARELDAVNKHITVDEGLVANAAKAYTELGEMLVEKLRWDDDEIQILPQGSASTQTLIAAPTAADFDIDAVCHVDLHHTEAHDPLAFFDEVFDALVSMRPSKKKRCMRINYPNQRFYIDFTPSVPLKNVPANVRAGMRNVSLYAETAVAVVDIPSKQWKTSNPVGMVKWVSAQADRVVLRQVLLDSISMEKRADIQPVLLQAVPLSDTLRVSVRLFKRHRDMAIKRGLIIDEFMPISVIITTLLTQCYEGMADAGITYGHPIELLADLAALLPGMIEVRGDGYWIANPTVDGENFAERWNNDNNQRYNEFLKWCGQLVADLKSILESANPAQLRERIQEVFGCVGISSQDSVIEPGWLAATSPTSVKSVPPKSGLA
jgi:hypothetical protein